jgi:hypothetical protein
MEQNLLYGFIMAGVGVLIAILGCSFYCVFSLRCAASDPDESGSLDTVDTGPAKLGIAADGNPEEPVTTDFKESEIEM